MAARLGNLIYWLGLAIAILAGLLAVLMFLSWYIGEPVPPPATSPQNYKNALAWREVEFRAAWQLAGICVGSFVIGRAARYILAGR